MTESTKKLIDNLAALIKVKTIVTMCVMWVFCRLTDSGAIAADNAMIIISMVISFYFGTQSKKERHHGTEGNDFSADGREDG